MGCSPEAGYSEPGSVTFQARGKSVAGYPALHGERFSAAIAAPAGRNAASPIAGHIGHRKRTQGIVAAVDRTITGAEQEKWLLDGFRHSTQRWDVLGQQVFFAERDGRRAPELGQ